MTTTTILRIDVDGDTVKTRVLASATDPRIAEIITERLADLNGRKGEDGRARRRKPIQILSYLGPVVPTDLAPGTAFPSARHLADALREHGVSVTIPSIRSALYCAAQHGKTSAVVAKLVEITYAQIRD